MRYLAIMLSIALAGCEATSPTDLLGGDMLGTAPQTDYDLMHPEWGVVQKRHALRAIVAIQCRAIYQQTTITATTGVAFQPNDPLEVFPETKPYRFRSSAWQPCNE